MGFIFGKINFNSFNLIWYYESRKFQMRSFQQRDGQWMALCCKIRGGTVVQLSWAAIRVCDRSSKTAAQDSNVNVSSGSSLDRRRTLRCRAQEWSLKPFRSHCCRRQELCRLGRTGTIKSQQCRLTTRSFLVRIFMPPKAA